MVDNGDSSKSFWLTEFGWSLGSDQYQVTEAKQAGRGPDQGLRQAQELPYVTRAAWSGFRNAAWLYHRPDEFEGGFGLVRTDSTRKPSFFAMQDVTAAQGQ